MFKRLFKYKPTTQEQHFIELVDVMLKHPDTVVRMTALSHKFYITNEFKHSYMLLYNNGIQVTNTTFSFTKSIHPRVFDVIMDSVYQYMEKDRQILEDKIFINESLMLTKMRENLKIT